jgi:hypothetical protein
MSNKNQVYMNIKEHAKEEVVDMGIEKLTEDIEIDMVDGVVNIAMPEPLFILLSSFIKKLNINLLNVNEIQK